VAVLKCEGKVIEAVRQSMAGRQKFDKESYFERKFSYTDLKSSSTLILFYLQAIQVQ